MGCLYPRLLTLGLCVLVMWSRDSFAAAPPHCDHYPRNQFQVCYFEGTDPTTGNYVGSEPEPLLSFPTPSENHGFFRNWGDGPVYAGISDGISAIWRGAPYFSGGEYHFTVVADDGVKLFIDGKQILTEWRNQLDTFVAAVKLKKGFHRIRLEWYEQNGRAHVELNWDRGPRVRGAIRSPIQIDAFVVTRQDVCIVGEPWNGIGDPERTAVTLYDSEGLPYQRWQRDPFRGLPKTLSPSSPEISRYRQAECLSLELTPEQVAHAREELQKMARDIHSWSFGRLRPSLSIREIRGEIKLSQIWNGFWVSPHDVRSALKSKVNRESDFTMVVSPTVDLQTGRNYPVPACDLTVGAGAGLHGTGYSWVPDTSGTWFQCLGEKALIHEWGHQFRPALMNVMGLNTTFGIDWLDPFHADCGGFDPDTFLWVSLSHRSYSDPDFAWCGMDPALDGPLPDNRAVEAHRILHHYDPSLRHYMTSYFTGNYCNNGRQDFFETGVDFGGPCALYGEVPGSSDLSVSLNEDSWAAGWLHFTMEVTNNGPDEAVTTTATLELPEGLRTYDGYLGVPSQGTCSATSLRQVFCQFGNIPPGASETITLWAWMEPHPAQSSVTTYANTISDVTDFFADNNQATLVSHLGP